MPDIFVAKEKKEQEVKIKKAEEKPEIEKDRVERIAPFSESRVGVFSTFGIKPPYVRYKEQDEDEEIILFLRRHLITNLPWLVLTFILVFAPLLFIIFRDSLPFSFLPARFFLVLTLIYYLALFNYAFINFITWYFNISIATNKRVIDIDYSDIVYYNIASTTLDSIEDVSCTQSGFFHSLFNFGDIVIQTAGEKAHFDFDGVPQPEHALNIIENLIGGDRNAR